MKVKDAVAQAKSYVADLFDEERLTNIGLEEIELDAGVQQWIVTIGFSRPWDQPRNSFAALATSPLPRRAYKVVRINSESGEVISVKNREGES